METLQNSMRSRSIREPGKDGLRLLSLDGGGVRGLSTLIILKRLMDRTNAERQERDQPPFIPCEIFDLIGGTSTGGIIAIMLGRLEMCVDECIEVYNAMFEKIFAKPKHRSPVSLLRKPGSILARFDSAIIRDAIQTVLRKRGLSASERFRTQLNGAKCRVFVCLTTAETNRPFQLRTYDLIDETVDETTTIVEAVLATSAATTFFDPVQIANHRYVDGGLGANNPIETLWGEAQGIWCPDDGNLAPRIKVLVSIGTGKPDFTRVKDGLREFLTKALIDMVADTERRVTEFASRHRDLLSEKRYHRFNVDIGLHDVGLEEYRKQPQIEEATQVYLNHQSRKFELRDCAMSLGGEDLLTPPSSIVRVPNADGSTSVIRQTIIAQAPLYFGVPHATGAITGREATLKRLEKLLGSLGKHARVVLYGLGGIGKTRVALEIATRMGIVCHRSVFWVHAASPQTFEKSFMDLAREVHIAGFDTSDPKVDKLGLVRSWLNSEKSREWLLVIDNVDDTEIFDTRTAHGSRLATYLPNFERGVILMTTRKKQVATKFTAAKNMIEIRALSTTESVELIQTKMDD
ncbi:hypothetical protein MMC25_003341 [Agyrium rufum]|nr:hypothetical protein [Agyrium rufum]